MKPTAKRKLIDALDDIPPEDLDEAVDIVKRDRLLRSPKKDYGM